jgi:hypothetical protein
MAKLVCRAGPQAGHEYPLSQEKTLFGRQKTCQVQVLDPMASREQFLVRRDGNLYTLVDLESRNGTFLNERRVTERQLEFGDVIRVGSVEYLLVREEGDTDIRDLLTKKYQIQEKIGEGGMGIVYRAMQRSMDRIVALKVLAPKFASRPRFVEQFVREARAAGALNHPNIIQVHDVGEENNIHYFSMEYVDGPTCMAMLRQQGPLPVSVCLEIVRQTAKALDYAHQQRLIHRDIKPDNIMVSSTNAVKLADLGISKTFDEAEAEGRPKRIVGTPHYMAPEAAMGRAIDHRVDLYSLGATLYHLLTGRTPFQGTTATDILRSQISEPVPALDPAIKGVTEAVHQLLARLLAKDPEARIQTAAEVVELIQGIQSTGLGGPAGHETVLLRKLVTEGQNRVGTAAPTAERRSGTKPSTASAGLSDEHARTLVRRALLVVAALLALVAAWIGMERVRRWMGGTTVAADTAPTTPPGGQTASSGGTTTATAAVSAPDPTDGARRQVRAQLDTIRHGVGEAPATRVGEMLEQLAALRPQAAAVGLSADVDRVEGTVKQRATALAEAAARSRLQAFREEVDTLRRTKDYGGAKTRIASFDAGGNAAVAGELERLNREIDEERQLYLRRLENQKAQYERAGNLDNLRELYRGLPPPVLNEPVAQAIARAIQDLEQRGRERVKESLGRARAALALWDLETARSILGESESTGSDPAVREERDGLTATAAAQEGLVRALAAVIQQEQARSFVGSIQGLNKPIPASAGPEGLSLRMDGGGVATVAWRRMTNEELRLLCAHFGLLREATVAEALTRIETLRGASTPAPTPAPAAP